MRCRYITYKFPRHIFPWKWICRKRNFAIAILITVLILLTIFICGLYFLNVHCSFEPVRKAVNVICGEYMRNETAGNLCAELCEKCLMVPKECIPNHLGKDVVFMAQYQGRQHVVKASHLYITDLDQVFWRNKTGNRYYPSILTFHDMLSNSVRVNLNLKEGLPVHEGTSLIQKLWSGEVSNFTELSTFSIHIIMTALWNLVQQPEYLLLKYYEDENIFPRIIGNCGHFYVQEFIRPLDNLFLLFYPSWQKDFSWRARLGLQIIYYLERLHENFPKLHFCDIKMGHFGLDSQGNVKMLDMDMVFSEGNLIQNIVSLGNCTNDQDCNFIDCHGSCNEESSKCRPIVTNTNFQRVCSNIFKGRLAPSVLGLLSLSPSAATTELGSLLEECSYPMDESTEAKILKQLKILLGRYS